MPRRQRSVGAPGGVRRRGGRWHLRRGVARHHRRPRRRAGARGHRRPTRPGCRGVHAEHQRTEGNPALYGRGAVARPRRQHQGQLQCPEGGRTDHDGAEAGQHHSVLVRPFAGRRARAERLRRHQSRHRPAGKDRGGRIRTVQRAGERHRAGRHRDAADRADQIEQGLVRCVCGQERVQSLGSARRDGRADNFPGLGRRKLRDRHDPVRRRRLARRRRKVYPAGDGRARQGFEVRGSGFGVWFRGSGFEVGFGVRGLGIGRWELGVGARALDSGVRR